MWSFFSIYFSFSLFFFFDFVSKNIFNTVLSVAKLHVYEVKNIICVLIFNMRLGNYTKTSEG